MTTVVLGAGAVGTATAWYLKKSGHDVVLLDRQPGAAMETSWGNGGVIHASEVEPWSQPGMPMKIVKWLGQENAPLLLRYGAIPHILRWGIDFARNSTPERFRENSKANLHLALHSLKSLQEIGAETGIAYDRATGGRVQAVITDKGRIAADTVVVAMGSFTAPLLAKNGIRVPIYPVKGISITFSRAGWNTAPQLPVIDDSKLFGLVPLGERMRISGSAEITGYDTTPAMARAEAIIANASSTFPEMKRHFDISKSKVWAGLRPVSPSGTPLIGETRIRGLWTNAGHGHLGWTLSCGSGRVLADLIDGRDPGIPVPPPQGVVVARV